MAHRKGLYVVTDQYRTYGPFSTIASADAFAYHMNNTPVAEKQEVADSQTRFPVRLADSSPGESRYAYIGSPMYEFGTDTDGVMLVASLNSSYAESLDANARIVGYWGGTRGEEGVDDCNVNSGIINVFTGTNVRDGWIITSGLVQQRVQDIYNLIEGEWVENLGNPGRQLKFDDTYGRMTGFNEADENLAGCWYSKSPWLPTSAVHTLVYMYDVQTVDFS